jgi:hypothetical protein
MKKLALDLDGLRVDSFSTLPRPTAARGTVCAHDAGTLRCQPTINDPTLPSGCGCGTGNCTLTCAW